MATHTKTFNELDRSSGGERSRHQLIVALDCQQPMRTPLRLAIDKGLEIGRGDERSVADIDGGRHRLNLADSWLSTRHLSIRPDGSGCLAVDDGSKNGSFVAGRQFEQHALADGDVIQVGATLLLYRNAPLSEHAKEAPPEFQTFSAEMADRYRHLARASRSQIPIVIGGETGTGKEVAAQAVHRLSGRGGPFIAVNCGALPKSLIEAELFGAQKGAFSGAEKERPGLIRASSGGTLFLDEIAELPLGSQATLLRALQEKEVTPVGATEPVSVDLRVVAATHKDLHALAESGQFRQDLYARLLGFRFDLLPLRKRAEDIGLLIARLLPRAAEGRADAITFHTEAGRALLAYDWPLNVRELFRLLASAVAVAENGAIELAHFPAAVADALSPAAGAASKEPDCQRDRLDELLTSHRGNVSAVARELGTSRSQIRRLAERHGIDLDSYR